MEKEQELVIALMTQKI